MAKTTLSIGIFLHLAFTAGFFALPHYSAASALIDLNTLSEASRAQVIAQQLEPVNEVEEGSVAKVEVLHKQKGLLLALVPITFTVKAIAYADGRVEIDYPWYSALTLDQEEEVIAKAKVRVDNALRSRMVGSVRGEGEVKSPRFTESEAATVKTELRLVLEEALENQKNILVEK